jgi:phosphoadenosine phosphosulfate reductase
VNARVDQTLPQRTARALPSAEGLDLALRNASPGDVIAAALQAVGRETLGLRDVRSIEPLEETLSRQDPDRELWFSDPDACCRIRKVEPLARALAPFSAWINGRKRFQGGLRAAIPVVEADGTRLKFNPFANVSREEITAIYAAAKLPQHPLAASGYLSVGCMPSAELSRCEQGNAVSLTWNRFVPRYACCR